MNVMRTLLLSLICIPTIVFSQNVLDGIYIEEKVETKKDYEIAATPIGGSVKMEIIKDSIIKKPLKVKGFQYINTKQYFPAGTPTGLGSHEVLNHLLYTANDSMLIGNCTTGDVVFANSSKYNQSRKFYFKQHEVTNGEYKEFIKYVVDSVKLTLLAEEEPNKFLISAGEHASRLNWNHDLEKVFADEANVEVLETLNLQKNDEIYHGRKQIDSRKLIYEYWDKKNERHVLPIYPDTLSWVNDLSWSWNEPMTQMYFWHPVYDNYPVVGVNYHQAKAYLHWRQKQGIKELDKKGIQYEIGLPTPEEWEYTASLMYSNNPASKKKPSLRFFNEFKDKNIAFDLEVKSHPKFYSNLSKENSFKSDRYKTILGLKKAIDPYDVYFENLVEDGSMHTISVSYANEDMPGFHSAFDQVFHLGTNVSEWMDASYSDYKPYLTLRRSALLNSNRPELNNIGEDLSHKISNFKENYQLLIGANWMDEHYQMFFGAPMKAIYSKTFLHPDSTHSTIGFRYVIRLKSDSVNDKPLEIRKYESINIYDELKKAGFVVQLDSSMDANKSSHSIHYIHPKKKAEFENPPQGPVLDGTYISTHNSRFIKDYPSYSFLYHQFPKLLKTITSTGGVHTSFYATIPEGADNLLQEYRIKMTNEYSLELIKW